MLPQRAELVRLFLRYLLKTKRYSSHTVSNYKRDIDQFFLFLDESDRSEVSLQVCRGFIQWLYPKQYAPRSISRKIAALRSFWKFLIRRKVFVTNPWVLLKSPKQPHPLPKVVDTDQLNQFLSQLPKNSPQAIRNALVIELLYGTGIRVSELVHIDLDDIDFDQQTIRIIGKGDKERLVLFGGPAKQCLTQYLNEVRPLWDRGASTSLLINNHRNPNIRGRGLTSRSVLRILVDLSRESGLVITPHTLRHNFATDMLNAGADLKVIQELLGHCSLRTTQIYAKLSDQVALDELVNHHPFFKKN